MFGCPVFFFCIISFINRRDNCAKLTRRGNLERERKKKKSPSFVRKTIYRGIRYCIMMDRDVYMRRGLLGTSTGIAEETLQPYEIGRFAYVPGKIVYCFTIIMESKVIETPGLLSRMLESFKRRGISLVHIKASRQYKDQPPVLVLFADMTKRLEALSDIVRELKAMEYVKQVIISAPLFNGFALETNLFPLTLLGERVIILRRTLYEAFLKELRSILGSGYASLMYYTGLEMGRKAFRYHYEIAGRDLKNTIAISEAIFRIVGYGIMKILELDLSIGRARIRVHHCFECEIFKNSGKPSSHLIRGMIAGWFSELLRRRVKAIETRCIAKGDKYCEFLVMGRR